MFSLWGLKGRNRRCCRREKFAPKRRSGIFGAWFRYNRETLKAFGVGFKRAPLVELAWVFFNYVQRT
jgi:hypothetical protein